MRLKLNFLLKILVFLLIGYVLIDFINVIKFIFDYLLKLILPFLIAFVISFILQPVVNLLLKTRLNKKQSIILTLIIFFAVIITFIIFIVPIIKNQIQLFISEAPSYLKMLFEKISILKNKGIDLNKFGLNIENIKEVIMSFKGVIFEKIFLFLESIFSYFVVIILLPILIIYFMIYYDDIEKILKNKLLKYNFLFNIFKRSKSVLRNYFNSIFIIIFILSVIACISFAILGLDHFLLWGIIIGITDLIPYFGPYIGGIIVLLFVISSKPFLFWPVLIILFLLQALEGFFLTPKIQGDSLKINPILVIFSILFFGEILGIFGMLIAVPITAFFKIILEEFNLKQKNELLK